jgi:Survival motor neuron (SMN) interacting protein 1 (SIP1)
MGKRTREGPIRPVLSYTAGPIDEHRGQRSVFPEVVKPEHTRDTEWLYDGDNADEEPDIGEEDFDEEELGEEDLTGQTFTLDELDFGEDEDEDEGEVELVDEAWEVEPQGAALEYLQNVRSEADALPNLTYVPDRPDAAIQEPTADEAQRPNGDNAFHAYSVHVTASEENDGWRTQFLSYYTNLRQTIASAPEPNLTQDELDSLLHINPHRRPTTSVEEDGLWRNKTLELPSVSLLAMLDHQRTMHLLIHLRKKMSVNVKVEQCIWLVCLLARLGDVGVLSGDEMDLLRRIGRKCFGVKRSLEEGGGGGDRETVMATADMVICVIKYFYRQMDLEA